MTERCEKANKEHTKFCPSVCVCVCVCVCV